MLHKYLISGDTSTGRFWLHLDFCLSKSHRVPIRFVNILCPTLASSQFPLLPMSADWDLAIWADWKIWDKPGMVLSNLWFTNSPTNLLFLWSKNETSSVTCCRSQGWMVSWDDALYREKLMLAIQHSGSTNCSLAKIHLRHTHQPDAKQAFPGNVQARSVQISSSLASSLKQQFWRHSIQLWSAL